METVLFRNAHFVVGRFECAPESTRWREPNRTGDGVLFAFPRTSVVIEQDGREPVLATRNHVVFYNPAQQYRRRLHDERGDRCVFVEVERGLAAELLRSAGLPPPLPFDHGPSDARAHLLQHRAVLELESPATDVLEVEELLHETLLRSLVCAAELHRRRRRAVRSDTNAQRHRLVEDAKALLTERVSDPLTLPQIARALHTSEFHLARVFREQTGFTLHGYRTHLRLRLALDRLDDERGLATVACELGFSSHSHFTDAFRTLFGATPSVVRAQLTRPRLRELRRKVEAPLRCRS